MQTPNGILPVDKPAGWTSFDVLAKLRGALGTRKLGHSGTLDPMATGVLAVFIGKATAAADRQLNHDKTYEATIRLGPAHRYRRYHRHGAGNSPRHSRGE